MSNEENIKKETMEEMAQKLSGVLEDQETDESENVENVSEETKEETNAEEVTEETKEEAAVDEVSEETKEETAVGETTEETKVDDLVQEDSVEEEKKPFWKQYLAWIISGGVVFVLALIYLIVAGYYSDKLLMKTSVNGNDCSGMTVQEVERFIQKQVEEYALTIQTNNDMDETIIGTEIDIKYIGYNQLKEAFKVQNEFSWPKAMFQGRNIDVEIIFEYNQEKLDAKIASLICMKPESQVAPTPATVVLKDGTFVIQDEVYGTQIDNAKLMEQVNACVKNVDTTLSLEQDGCYVQPKFTKKSPEVLQAKDSMNQCLNAEITYSLDGVEMKLTKETFASWIFVDANMGVGISDELAAAYVKTVAAKYNTPNRVGNIVTPKGKTVPMNNASLGRSVGNDAEKAQLIEEIKGGKVLTRKPVIAREEMPEGQFIWGTTYIEVDITEQHMWLIQNGQVVFECDVVTGVPNPKRATPTGIYTILEKLRNKVLRGEIMPNGKREYETPVAYWARVTWSGIGFHDATWQPKFGGQLYKQGYGSHGCINMPLEEVRKFYDMISVGTPVVIHN